jgi:uncharacterized Zn finger protein
MVAGQTELRRRGSSLAVRKTGYGRYVVASSAGGGKEYVVTLQTENQSCTCPVNEARKQVCKHMIRAADYVLQAEPSFNGGKA